MPSAKSPVSWLEIDAIVVSNGNEIMKHILFLESMPDIVAVDEAFMIDGVSDALKNIYKLGVTIVVASLDLSSTCQPFEEILSMMPYATKIEKCPAVCTICGEDAFYTHKKLDNKIEIEVGGKNLYEPRCWQHHSYMNDRN